MIKQQEDDLFSAWVADLQQKSVTGQFAQDGIADEHTFQQAPFKILFFLKESIGGNNTCLSVWDEREFIKNGGNSHATWLNITRWTRLLLGNHTSWLVDVSEQERKKVLPYISVMNIKKISGGNTSSDGILRESLTRDIVFLRKQLQLYRPNLLVCCHNTREWFNTLFGKEEKDWTPNPEKVQKGFHYLLETSFWQNHTCLVLDCQHPSKWGKEKDTPAAKYFEELKVFWEDLRRKGILQQAGIR